MNVDLLILLPIQYIVLAKQKSKSTLDNYDPSLLNQRKKTFHKKNNNQIKQRNQNVWTSIITRFWNHWEIWISSFSKLETALSGKIKCMETSAHCARMMLMLIYGLKSLCSFVSEADEPYVLQ